MKTWKPDTCDCEVEEIYNGTDIIGGGQVLKKCVAHQSIADADLYGVLYSNPDGENKRKNTVESILLGGDSIKTLGLEEMKKNADGSDAGIGFKNGIKYNWAFSGSGNNRTLTISVDGAILTTQQKNAIKTLCNSKFGISRVVVQ